MQETKLEVGSVTFESQKWTDPSWDRVSIQYTEHATDHWSSDTERDIDVSRDDALRIVRFLLEAYPGLLPKDQP